MLKEMEHVLICQCGSDEVTVEEFDEHMVDCLTIRWAINYLKDGINGQIRED